MTTPKTIRVTPRLQRLLHALLAAPAGLSREDADRATPASNSPEYIRTLRNRFGFDIPIEHIRFTTVDGKASQYGLYTLTKDDRKKAAELLAG